MLLAGAAAGAVSAIEPLDLHPPADTTWPTARRTTCCSAPRIGADRRGALLGAEALRPRRSRRASACLTALLLLLGIVAPRRCPTLVTGFLDQLAGLAATAATVRDGVEALNTVSLVGGSARRCSACSLFIVNLAGSLARPRRRRRPTTRGTATRSSGHASPPAAGNFTVARRRVARAAARQQGAESRGPSPLANDSIGAAARAVLAAPPPARVLLVGTALGCGGRGHGLRRPARRLPRHGPTVARTGGAWLPEGVTIPLTPATMGLITLLMSAVVVQWAVYAVGNDDRAAAYCALGLTLVLGAAYIDRDGVLLHADRLRRPRRRAGFGVLLYAITGMHLAMVGAAMVFMVADGVPHARRSVLRPGP